MKLSKLSAAAIVLAGFSGAACAQSFVAFAGSGFTTETTTVPFSYLTPIGPAGSTVTSYSVLSTAPGFGTTATITFAAPVTSYPFLWGSPDVYNSVTDGPVTVTGSSFSSGTGLNSESMLYTFSDLAGFTSLTFATTGIAFELARVSPVPEPGPFALVLAGLGVIGFAARRGKRL
jgi:hypothetical protein